MLDIAQQFTTFYTNGGYRIMHVLQCLEQCRSIYALKLASR